MPAIPTVAGISVISRRELHEEFDAAEAFHEDTLRNLIVGKRRADVLAKEVLGYRVEWHHLQMIKHQHRNPWSLVLLPRGHGKTIICQVVDSILEILCDPNIRLIYGSRAATNACDTLAVVKKHFESNERLRALFGNYVGDKWNQDSIVVKKRTSIIREPTVVVISPDSSVASKHGDVGYGDDFAVEENSRTPTLRGQLETFFWKTFIPTLEPDTSKLRISGTRYNPKDLYGHLGAPEGPGKDPTNWDGLLVDSTLVLPAIYKDEDGNEHSLWPDKFSLEFLQRLRRGNRITFESQYQQNVAPMKGSDYVKYDQINRFRKSDEKFARLLRELPHFDGFDLAIGLKEENDDFCGLVAAYDEETGNIYFHTGRLGKFRFNEQQRIIITMSEEWDVVRGIVETIQYQKAQLDEVKRKRPLLPVYGFKPRVDKLTRFERRSGLFEEGKVWIEEGLDWLVEQILDFTGKKGEKDDAVDAFLLVIRAIMRRERKKRPKGLEALP